MLNPDGLPSAEIGFGKVAALVAYVQQHHIVLFTESRTPPAGYVREFLPDYRLYHTQVAQRGVKGQGVSVFVHKVLWDSVHLCAAERSPDRVWIKVRGEVCGFPGWLHLCACYLRPQSAEYQVEEILTDFSTLSAEVEIYRQQGEII